MRRVRVAVAVFLALLVTAGCTAKPPKHTDAVPTPGLLPAAASGGSCQLLDFDEITTDLGLTFDVAAASEIQDTFTCVLERQGAPLPDLTFSIALVSSLDITTFKAKLVPSGAAVIGDLGKIGYSRTAPAAAGAGPTVEVGWLAGNGRLIILRCRLATTSTAADATALAPRLVVLAHRIDLTSV